jgi:hypothetical protein
MSDSNKKIQDKCLLHEANGLNAWCTRESCIYWRMLKSQDIDDDNEVGCGLQHYNMLQNLSPEMAEWLLTIKRRLENSTPEAGKSRITFRHREEE